jgi:hypothetical protein
MQVDVSERTSRESLNRPEDALNDQVDISERTSRESLNRPEDALKDIDVPIAHRKATRRRRLPARYIDTVAQPLPIPIPNPEHTEPEPPTQTSTESVPSSMGSRLRRVFCTRKNIFGLFRRFFSETFPTHDPEEGITHSNLCTSAIQTTAGNDCDTSSDVYPYPNQSSFQLGHWYWNEGCQKSKESFKDLVKIITDTSFNIDDIRATKWNEIDATLGGECGEDEEWLDAGWYQSDISIKAPFHKKTDQPGCHEFVSVGMYHRSLVEVIQEKFQNPQDFNHFHIEPYELLWKPSEECEEMRLYGEIYTSEAFINAHTQLQESPGEPGCDLPRVIASLMFSSDVTHLTAFGDAKIWPCYLYFGNESKYRRSKPSCRSCSHIAYFHKVLILSLSAILIY